MVRPCSEVLSFEGQSLLGGMGNAKRVGRLRRTINGDKLVDYPNERSLLVRAICAFEPYLNVRIQPCLFRDRPSAAFIGPTAQFVRR